MTQPDYKGADVIPLHGESKIIITATELIHVFGLEGEHNKTISIPDLRTISIKQDQESGCFLPFALLINVLQGDVVVDPDVQQNLSTDMIITYKSDKHVRHKRYKIKSPLMKIAYKERIHSSILSRGGHIRMK